MNHELDPRLRVKAERILETKSEFKGEIYWRSRAKRALDILISTPSLVPILPIISVLGIAIFIDDGHWPFFNQQCGHPKEKKPFYPPSQKTMVVLRQAQDGERSRTMRPWMNNSLLLRRISLHRRRRSIRP